MLTSCNLHPIYCAYTDFFTKETDEETLQKLRADEIKRAEEAAKALELSKTREPTNRIGTLPSQNQSVPKLVPIGIKHNNLVRCLGFAAYWNFWPCAYKILAEVINALDDDPVLSKTAKEWGDGALQRLPLQSATTVPYHYGWLFLNEWPGFYGWRLIATVGKTHMRCSINFVVSKEFVEYFPQGKKGLAFQAGNYKNVPAYTTQRNQNLQCVSMTDRTKRNS